MPKVRVNLRELDDADDVAEELEEREQRGAREGRSREEKGRHQPSTQAVERRQAERKWGKEIARFLRERKSDKP